jgi:hypothetical protein
MGAASVKATYFSMACLCGGLSAMAIGVVVEYWRGDLSGVVRDAGALRSISAMAAPHIHK